MNPFEEDIRAVLKLLEALGRKEGERCFPSLRCRAAENHKWRWEATVSQNLLEGEVGYIHELIPLLQARLEPPPTRVVVQFSADRNCECKGTGLRAGVDRLCPCVSAEPPFSARIPEAT